MDLSVIIINWNTVGLLRNCLSSVYSNTTGLRVEVLVLDNASYDGSAQLVATEFPAVRFFQNTENVGFGAGNNQAAQQARGRVLLFLNSDTEVLDGALQQMFACIEAAPDAGAVGPKLLNPDGSTQNNSLQSFPSILNQFVDAGWLRRLFPRWQLWGNRALLAGSRDPLPVEGIVGACLMIRRPLFNDLGGFNPAYFMYAEDMDLCYRLAKIGKTNYHVGTARVVHHGGQSSSSQSDQQFSAIVMRDSLRSFMDIHHGPLYASLYQASMLASAVLRLMLLSFGLLLPASAQRRNSMRRTFAKWQRVLRWAGGFERRVPVAAGSSLLRVASHRVKK